MASRLWRFFRDPPKQQVWCFWFAWRPPKKRAPPDLWEGKCAEPMAGTQSVGRVVESARAWHQRMRMHVPKDARALLLRVPDKPKELVAKGSRKRAGTKTKPKTEPKVLRSSGQEEWSEKPAAEPEQSGGQPNEDFEVEVKQGAGAQPAEDFEETEVKQGAGAQPAEGQGPDEEEVKQGAGAQPEGQGPEEDFEEVEVDPEDDALNGQDVKPRKVLSARSGILCSERNECRASLSARDGILCKAHRGSLSARDGILCREKDNILIIPTTKNKCIYIYIYL